MRIVVSTQRQVPLGRVHLRACHQLSSPMSLREISLPRCLPSRLMPLKSATIWAEIIVAATLLIPEAAPLLTSHLPIRWPSTTLRRVGRRLSIGLQATKTCSIDLRQFNQQRGKNQSESAQSTRLEQVRSCTH